MAVGNAVCPESHATVHFGIGIGAQDGGIFSGSFRSGTHYRRILARARCRRPDTDGNGIGLIAVIRFRILTDYDGGYALGGSIQADSHAAGIRGRIHACFLAQSDAAFTAARAAFRTDRQSAVITGS